MIYFIQCREFVKVGFAIDPTLRATLLQVGNPYRLDILRTYPGDVLVERRIHRILANWRDLGEWFRAEFVESLFFLFDVLGFEEALDLIELEENVRFAEREKEVEKMSTELLRMYPIMVRALINKYGSPYLAKYLNVSQSTIIFNSSRKLKKVPYYIFALVNLDEGWLRALEKVLGLQLRAQTADLGIVG